MTADLDKLLDSARQSADLEVRADFLRRAETLLLDEQPMIPLYVYSTKKLVSPGVTGWVDNSRSIHLSRYLSLGD